MSPEQREEPSITLGLFDWIDSDGVRAPGQLYRERLDLLAEAEPHGFDIYHLAEHHGTPLGLAPSPSVFLAAAAVRTTRIRLSPMVYVRATRRHCHRSRFGAEGAPALRDLRPA